ncbi:MAG TPA: hypothetical protein DD671_02290, partial [Balneolaceae bacterium]|nr:hypothetical protein [Balneolaceae bacterium]
MDSGKVRRSEHYHELYGLEKKPKRNNQEYYFSAIHPEDRDDVRQKLDLVKKGKTDSFNIDYRVQWLDNSIHWLRSQATLIPESESHFATLAGVVKDVTAQKELEEKFAREKELFESIFQNIPIMIDVNSPDITSIRVNKAYEDITGWTQEEIRDKNIMKEVYPDPATREKAKQVIDEANGEWHEFETLTKEGEKRIQRWANIRLSDGSTVGIGLDVTEQKELQRMHERDRRELQKVYDNIPVFVSLYKGRKEVHRINKYFEDVIGYKDEDLTSADLVFELIPDRDDRIEAERHLEEADGSWLDFKLTTKSGDIIDTTWTVIKVTSSLKMGIGIDTTELKQKERELKDLNKRYKNAEKLARLGHWKRNLKTNKSVVSTGFFEIAEMDPEKETITFDTLKDIVHEEDWDDFVSNVEKGIEKGANDFHYRIVGQRTGNVKHIHELEKVEYDE